MVIKKIGPLSLAKISGTLYAILGLVFGALFSLIALTGGVTSGSSEAFGFEALMGAGAVILFPIFYGAIGFVAAFVSAWLYNLLAGVVGGIELELQ